MLLGKARRESLATAEQRGGEEPRRRATDAEEQWLDSQDCLQRAEEEWLISQTAGQEASVGERETHRFMKNLQHGSAFLLHPDLAESTSIDVLVSMRSSAQQLINIIDDSLFRALENERRAARQQMNSMVNFHKDLAAAALAERMQLEAQLSQHKEHEEDLLRLLEEEKERTICRICFTNPRDVLTLPCMHFDYCSQCIQQHQQRSSACPSCRRPISGILKCNLAMN